MNPTLFGLALTKDSLMWVSFFAFAVLLVVTIALLFDKKSWREPPHYLLPCRGTVYFTILFAAAALLVGVLFIKLKYFP